MSSRKPQRPKQHRREDVSKRVFESAIPSTWAYEPKPQREYGVDGIIEIFDGDVATGLRFNVQLKGVDKLSASKVTIKTTTRNYWKDLDSPTLVVLVDGSDTIHFGWSHQFDVYGRKKDAVSHSFELPSVWEADSPIEVEREVRAARASVHLRANLPIYWSLNADSNLPARWVAIFRTTLERSLGSAKELTRRSDEAGAATLSLSIDNTAISIRLHGMPGGALHSPADGFASHDPSGVVADVVLGVAFELGRRGLDVLGVDLIEQSISESSMLGRDPELTQFAATLISGVGRGSAAITLTERIYFDSSREFGFLVPLVFARDRGRLSNDDISRIAERMIDHAMTIDDEPAAELLYNAGNMLRKSNLARGLELYERAADTLPAYRTRGYWWRERGEISADSGDLEAARSAYLTAVELGDQAAVPLLADVYAALGKYERAVATWDGMRDVTRFVWLLKMSALQALIAELAISEQKRDSSVAELLLDQQATGVEVLAADALNIWGLWRAAVDRRDAKLEGYSVFYLAAAAFAVSNPMLWFEALLATDEYEDPDDHSQAQMLVITSAAQECGDSFRQFVLEDEHVPDDIRGELADLIDHAPKYEEPLVVRAGGEEIE